MVGDVLRVEKRAMKGRCGATIEGGGESELSLESMRLSRSLAMNDSGGRRMADETYRRQKITDVR
jgi:hypothetical protein